MKLKFTSVQVGELFTFAEVFLWSLFPIFTYLSLNSLPPLFAGGISTVVSALFFAILLTIQGKWSDLKVTSILGDILISTLFIGIFFYGLVFLGMEKTSPGDTSIVLLMEIFFAMIIFHFWGKEKITKNLLIGAILMFIGAFLILFQGSLELNIGNLMILLATAIAPAGNFYQQRARKKVSSTYIMFVRSLISGIFLLVLGVLKNEIIETGALNDSIWFILVNGIFLLGVQKIFWLEAIHRIPVTKAISFGTLTPALTLLFSYFLLDQTPTLWQFFGLIPILAGAWIITDLKKIL